MEIIQVDLMNLRDIKNSPQGSRYITGLEVQMGTLMLYVLDRQLSLYVIER